MQKGNFLKPSKKEWFLLLQSDDSEQVSNYRPISILPAIYKVIEKAIAEQLSSYLEKNQLRRPVKFGFCCGYLTESVTSYLTDNIIKNL